ncbi:MAG: flagellar basal body P-ring protein FlgI [bacterium]
MKMPIKHTFIIAALMICTVRSEVRIKDIAYIQGLEETQLLGYGLIVGLNGTGDGPRTMFTVQSVINMLRNLGIYIPYSKIRVRNVAAVMVIAKMVPFMKRGSKLDVIVSSMGDARSLEGGTLLMTPLQGPDRETYAIAQGAISVGGFNVELIKGTWRKKNHTLAGYVSDGAIIKKEILTNELNSEQIRVSLNRPDFTSAIRMAKSIDAKFNENIAEAEDAATINVMVPVSYQEGGGLVEFISELELLNFEPSTTARVVINEKTGTIVAGGNVKIDEVAVAHGNINIEVQDTTRVSQPSAPMTAGQTVVTEDQKVKVDEEKTEMVVLPTTSTVADLAMALNSLGVSPRDVISIFQAIKKAGALQADLIVM